MAKNGLRGAAESYGTLAAAELHRENSAGVACFSYKSPMPVEMFDSEDNMRQVEKKLSHLLL